MHETPTVDIGIVLDGECILELEGGESRRLQQGDWYVHHGTFHAWTNDSGAPCRLAVVLIGARRADAVRDHAP
jgi:quercetin dioxygenase-like cupin family protein